MSKPRKIKVNYVKLGREKAYGFAHFGENRIEVDSSLYGKKLLEITIHECLHILFPKVGELSITEKAIILTNTLWQEGVRYVDNSNDIPLQDGKK